MSLRTSANRYAKALFDVALEEKADLAKVDQDLQAVVEMMKGSPELERASGFSSTSDAQRQALMESVSKAMSLTGSPSENESKRLPSIVERSDSRRARAARRVRRSSHGRKRSTRKSWTETSSSSVLMLRHLPLWTSVQSSPKPCERRG